MPITEEMKKLLLQKGITGVSDPNGKVRIYCETEKDAEKLLMEMPEVKVAGISYEVEPIVSGRFFALQSRAEKWRPAPGGVSIGHPLVTGGTLGAVLYDNTGRKVILSNNHILAASNQGKIGDKILQPGCLPPNSIVLTNFGISKINELNEGSKVLGTKGFVKILKTMSRYHKGEMIRVKPYRNLPFDLTPEHPVLVIETDGFRNGEERKKALNKEPKWKKAEDLSNKDFLLVPRIKEEKVVENIKIIKYRYHCKNCGHSWTTYNKPKTPTCGRCKAKGNKIEYKGIQEKIIDINDPDFAFLIGLFVADGNANKLSISISLTKSDKWFIEKTKYLFHKFFGKCSTYTYGNVVRIYLNSRPIADWFKANCYENKEKRLPSFSIYMPTFWLKQLLEGLLVGDGRRDEGFGILHTTSKILAYQLSLILAKIGVIPNIRIANYESVRRKRSGKEIHEKEGYEVMCLPKYKQVEGLVFDDFVAVQIEKVESYDYEGMVYNLETEDNTFSLPFIVHNSYDGGTDADAIATLYRFVELKQEGNLVDAALALPLADNLVSEDILGIGRPTGFGTAVEGMHVKKSGRTTGVTEGTVFDTKATIKVYGYPWGYSTFEDQIIITPAMMDGGDSGCVILDDSNRIVGLGFAGSDKFAVANKIQYVVSMLGLSERGVAPTSPSLGAVGLLLLFALFGYLTLGR